MDIRPIGIPGPNPKRSTSHKTLGQVAYEGWAQGLPGCEWDNQTNTQKNAWEKAAEAVLRELK